MLGRVVTYEQGKGHLLLQRAWNSFTSLPVSGKYYFEVCFGEDDSIRFMVTGIQGYLHSSKVDIYAVDKDETVQVTMRLDPLNSTLTIVAIGIPE